MKKDGLANIVTFHLIVLCSSDSKCIGITANKQSICVCPLHKFGSRCFLVDGTCLTKDGCQNGDQCIPGDNYYHRHSIENNVRKLLLDFGVIFNDVYI